jgi:hypothetical protein
MYNKISSVLYESFLPMRKKLLRIVTVDSDGTIEMTIHIVHSSNAWKKE